MRTNEYIEVVIIIPRLQRVNISRYLIQLQDLPVPIKSFHDFMSD